MESLQADLHRIPLKHSFLQAISSFYSLFHEPQTVADNYLLLKSIRSVHTYIAFNPAAAAGVTVSESRVYYAVDHIRIICVRSVQSTLF